MVSKLKILAVPILIVSLCMISVSYALDDAMWEAEYQTADDELNKQYKILMKKLRPKEKEQLRKTQRAWLKFRDAYYDFYKAVDFDYMPQTMLLESIDKRTNEIKDDIKRLTRPL